MKTEQTQKKEYDFKAIASDKNSLWDVRKEFFCDVTADDSKFYALGMFPYPSGNAHMGHVRVYTIVDIKSRYKRLKGKNVLNPLGWDAFGLPAENAAISNRIDPSTWTKQNIERMKHEQFVDMGWTFDFAKELSTCTPDYYRWTQWIFLQFFKHGLAYRANGMVNWCPVDQTVLANEQVIDGKCWRDGAVVEKREMQQWFFKITSYSERLWNDIPKLKNWAPEAVAVQKNWINKSTGVKVKFKIPQFDAEVDVFTTRIDTLYGVTALVIAPEHPLVKQILIKIEPPGLKEYVEASLKRSAVERVSSKEKTGAATHVYAIHPLTGQPVSIWVGDYVLGDYGTGAVMCVPAHDQRDFEFAKKMKIEIVEVIKNSDATSSVVREAFCEDGVLCNSGEFSGLSSTEARRAITSRLQREELGQEMTTYNLRDWSVGRQRYWGAPIPIVYCPSCGIVPVPEKDLPVLLPTDISLNEGKASLVNHPTFSICPCPQCGESSRRETDTLDTFICSSWYAFRFLDPQNTNAIFDSKKVNAWMPIDFYVGGLEHAAQHMIYFRFFTKFFKDIGLINFEEPVDHFFCNGMVRMNGSKMSKSKGNIVVPTEVVDKFGSDALRLYIMSDTPAELDIDWSDDGVFAKHQFLKKCYKAITTFLADNCMVSEGPEDLESCGQAEVLPEFYGFLQQLEQSLEANAFHNGIARLHEMANLLLKAIAFASDGTKADRAIVKLMIRHFIVVSSVFTPYFSEDLYGFFPKSTTGVYKERWPEIDPRFLIRNTVEIVVQVNGRKRKSLRMPKGTPIEELERVVNADPTLESFLAGKKIAKRIYVQDKIYNIVVN